MLVYSDAALTEYSTPINWLDSQNFGNDFDTPITIAALEAELQIEPSITESMADDIQLYDSNSTMNSKHTDIDNSVYTFPSHIESHDLYVSSPTGSSSSVHSEAAGLLDLETFSTWDSPNYDNMVPETVLQSPETPQYITPKSNTKNNRIVATKGKSIKSTANTSLPQPTKVSKRRSSSLTSELEIQIEIEESTKRAKRCTAPLTEAQKLLRRKELNRLAAQRCRSKRKSHADVLEEEIERLAFKNKELKERLEELETTKTELYDVIKFHFNSCHK